MLTMSSRRSGAFYVTKNHDRLGFKSFVYSPNRVTSAELGNLSSGSITNINWRQE
jgi:hypothetical protein